MFIYLYPIYHTWKTTPTSPVAVNNIINICCKYYIYVRIVTLSSVFIALYYYYIVASIPKTQPSVDKGKNAWINMRFRKRGSHGWGEGLLLTPFCFQSSNGTIVVITNRISKKRGSIFIVSCHYSKSYTI